MRRDRRRRVGPTSPTEPPSQDTRRQPSHAPEARRNDRERHGTTWNGTKAKERHGKRGTRQAERLKRRRKTRLPPTSQRLTAHTRLRTSTHNPRAPAPTMTTRTAEEAGLPGDHEHRAVRLRTGSFKGVAGAENPQDTDTAEELDALAYIDIPEPNPLDIHGWNQNTVFENLDKAQLSLWNAEPGTKILAYKAYGGRIEDREEATKLRDLIKTNLNLDANPTVTIPVPETRNNRKDTPPYCALVGGITEAKARDLLNMVTNPPHPRQTETDHRSRDSSPRPN